MTIYPISVAILIVLAFAAREAASRYGWGIAALLFSIVASLPQSGPSITFSF